MLLGHQIRGTILARGEKYLPFSAGGIKRKGAWCLVLRGVGRVRSISLSLVLVEVVMMVILVLLSLGAVVLLLLHGGLGHQLLEDEVVSFLLGTALSLA
jgi:hypothetical protein